MKLSISTTKRQTLLGLSYLLISMFVLPVVLVLCNALLKNPLSETAINLVYFGLNFAVVIGIFHGFLWESLKAFWRAPWKSLRSALIGLALYFGATFVIGFAITHIDPDFVNVNDDNIMGLFDEYAALMTLTAVILVPITEEMLYRGVLFQSLQRRNRAIAYAVSVLVFASIHVIGYIGMYDLQTLALCFMQYLPAGICLAWAYEKSDNIIAPILMHITINQIGVSASR